MDIYKILEKKNNELYDVLTEEKPNINPKSASEKEKFDYYIKRSFIKGNPYLPSIRINNDNEDFGFKIKRYQRFYDRYLSQKLRLEDKLSFDIRRSYDNGKGNEFKTGKYYSVASSSRFATSCFSENINGRIFLLNSIGFSNKTTQCDISLEKNLNIFSRKGSLIANPQMDVVIDLASKDIFFIEAKCHEIFDDDKHKNLLLKWKYQDVKYFPKLFNDSQIIKQIKRKTVQTKKGKEEYISINGKFLTANDFDCKLETYHFDFKQFICHLMGILSYQEENDIKIHFYYLFYKNVDYEKKEESNIYIQLEKEMAEIFGVFGQKFPKIDFGYLYNDKFSTLENIHNEYSKKKKNI